MVTLDDLKAILSKMRYVKTGDILLASDHNTLVDFDKTLVDYLSGVETRITSIEQQIASLQRPTVEEYSDALSLVDAARLVAKTIDVSYLQFGIWNAARYYLDNGKWAFVAKWIDDPFPCDCWRLGLHKREVARTIVDAGLIINYSTLPTSPWEPSKQVYLTAPTVVDMSAPLFPVYGMGIILSMYRPREMIDELTWAEGIYGEGNAGVGALYSVSLVYGSPSFAQVRVDLIVIVYPSTEDTVTMDVKVGGVNANPFSIQLPIDKRIVVVYLVGWPQGSQYGRLYIIVIDEDGNVIDAIEFTSNDGSADIGDLRLFAIPYVACGASNGQKWSQLVGVQTSMVYAHTVPPATRAASFIIYAEHPTITPTRTVTIQYPTSTTTLMI